MFILGFMVGASVVVVIAGLLLLAARFSEAGVGATSLLARHRIDDLERQTIARMLQEAQAQRGFDGEIIEAEAER